MDVHILATEVRHLVEACQSAPVHIVFFTVALFNIHKHRRHKIRTMPVQQHFLLFISHYAVYQNEQWGYTGGSTSIATMCMQLFDDVGCEWLYREKGGGHFLVNSLMFLFKWSVISVFSLSLISLSANLIYTCTAPPSLFSHCDYCA